MSKINQIQDAILELGGGEFQKLTDAYLVIKGFGTVNSIGSVVAKNKVKAGTPDTLLTTDSGGFIFAEHTTQQTGIMGKIKSDLSKCFDESKTGVSIDKIERVIFSFTARLSAEEASELAEVCQEKGVNLDLFGIDTLAFDLYGKYPGLALDFLGVQIDTGQVVSPERFVSLYNKSKLATPLDLGFHFREKELGQLLDGLEKEMLVILSGRPGIGKSRLALEVCQRFSDLHPKYKVMCIFGRNRDLWEDLQVWFKRAGEFIIFVDDANRVSQFDYVIDLLLHQREDQKIKVIATVRDYALSKIRETAHPVGVGTMVELGPFTGDQIKELITDEYNIRNFHYLERIADIARGNPRLAVMAAEVTKESSLSGINDVSVLYDSYFSSIREDLKGTGTDLESTDLLKTAAIVSFFKSVDRTNVEMMASIEEAFDISPKTFWEAVDRLHELEVIDIHENEVVRMSDQVLGTYLFYLAVFKEGALDFGALLCHFFPKMRDRLVDSLRPVLSAFDSGGIMDSIRPHVEHIWKKMKEEGDEVGLLHLLHGFWFTKRTDTLLWVQERINDFEFESVVVADIPFKKTSEALPSPSTLSVLRQFASAEVEEARSAVDILLRYLEKRQLDTPFILQILEDNYGFKPDFYFRRFVIQHCVVDAMWTRAEDGDPVFSRLFLTVANNYLGTHFNIHEMKNSGEIQFTRFDLPATSELVSLRDKIWNGVITLYGNEELQKDVLDLVNGYTSFLPRSTKRELVLGDVERVLPFLTSMLDPDNYRHCVVLHNYIDLLERYDVEVPNGLSERFSNEAYALAEVLLMEQDGQRELDMSFEEYEQFNRDRLEKFTSEYLLSDFTRFFEHCFEIAEALDEGRKHYKLQQGVENTLLLLALRNGDLFRQVVEFYLKLQDPFELSGYTLVRKLVEHQGPDGSLAILSEPDYPTKRRWLFCLHATILDDAVDAQWLGRLFSLYNVADLPDLSLSFDDLLKYLRLDSRVVAKVVSILLDKVDGEPGFARSLSRLFNPFTKTNERLFSLFAEDFNLLKRVYLVVENSGDHHDYDGKIFCQLLDSDPNFIVDYIDWKYETEKNGWQYRRDDDRDYSFIWLRSDFHEVMDRVVDSIYKHEQGHFVSIDQYVKTFFQNMRINNNLNNEVQERQNSYLLRLIDERNENVNFMEYLFDLISQFLPERRRLFIEQFVQRNKSFESFKRLSLESGLWSWSGSLVPTLQGRVDFWESLLSIMSTVELLAHKQYIERNIHGLRSDIEHEKKNDFIGN